MEEQADSQRTPGASDEREGSDAARWFAVTVRPQHEQSAQKGLEAKGLETYLPLYLAVRQWSDRTKTLQLPLFPGYVFCRFGRTQHTTVVRTPGVRTIVSFGGEPAPVPEVELEAVRRILASGSQVEPWPFLAAGQRIRIASGPLQGMEGTLVETPESCRLVVSVEMFQRSCAVRVERENVVALVS